MGRLGDWRVFAKYMCVLGAAVKRGGRNQPRGGPKGEFSSWPTQLLGCSALFRPYWEMLAKSTRERTLRALIFAHSNKNLYCAFHGWHLVLAPLL